MTSTMRFDRWENPTATQSVSFNQLVGGTGLVPIAVPIGNVAVAGGSASASVTSLGMVTFTSATSISLNNVFTSTYKNYAMNLRVSSGTDSNLYMRLRAAGVDETTAGGYAQGGRQERQNEASFAWALAPTTYFNLFTTTSASDYVSSGHLNIQNPAELSNTIVTSHASGFVAGVGVAMIIMAGRNGTIKVMDGFTLYPSAATTISGTLHVFGYND